MSPFDIQGDWGAREGVYQGEMESDRRWGPEPQRKLFPTMIADHYQIGHVLRSEFPVSQSPGPEDG